MEGRSRRMKEKINICITNMTKSYGEKLVFKDLNITIGSGKITCVMAPSGAGKTTLLRIMMGIEKPDSGSIVGLSDQRFSAVFQEERLCEDMTAIGNIRLVNPSLTPARIRNELQRLGMHGSEKQPVSELSGGMRRRVSILRALLAEYDVLFMDEPFKGLDSALKKDVITYVLEKTRGKTVIVVTHDRGEADLLRAEMIHLPTGLSGSIAENADEEKKNEE